MNDSHEHRESRDAIDRRIDAVLARRFALPPGLDDLAGRVRPRPRPVRRIGPLALWLAAAAALAVLGLRVAQHRAAPAPHAPAGRAVRTVAHLPPLEPFCSLVGPLEEAGFVPGQMRTPDLASLYHDMEACQRSSLAAACGESDLLAERMIAIYGQALDLRPEAAGRLHGPFASPEWPTGTIMIGTIVTEGHEDRTAVLVADLGTNVDCCVDIELPESSGLNVIPWRVGDYVLTEITPLEEPHLLAYFE